MLRWIATIATIGLIAVSTAAQVDGPAMVDDTDPRISISGTCARANTAGAIYGTSTRSCQHDFEYIGSALTVYAFATSSSQSVQVCVNTTNCQTLVYNAAGSSQVTFYVSSTDDPVPVRITSSTLAHFDAALVQPLPTVEIESGAVNVYFEWINPDDISRPQEWLVPLGEEGAQGAVIATITAGDVYTGTLLAVMIFSLWAFGLYFSIVRRSKS
jgi:hypothetical protein